MATIGLDKLFYSKITEDAEGNESYETPKQLAKAMTADLSVELAEATLYADDGAAEIVKEFKSGTLSLGVDDLGGWVLIVLYFFLTVAELFISPLGLSFVSKVAPKHLQGLCQGLWLGATAVGNLMLWVGPLMYKAIPLWQCWTVFLILCLISMGVMLGMVKWLERVTK